MPEFVESSGGALPGRRRDERTIEWPFDSKNLRNFSRISAAFITCWGQFPDMDPTPCSRFVGVVNRVFPEPSIIRDRRARATAHHPLRAALAERPGRTAENAARRGPHSYVTVVGAFRGASRVRFAYAVWPDRLACHDRLRCLTSLESALIRLQ